jgi:hypothetical protein
MGARLAIVLPTIGLAVFFPGCSHLDASGALKPGRRVPLRFHLASEQPRESWQIVKDEYGKPLHYDPEPLLTDADVADATALHSEERSIVVLYFKWAAAARLERFTAEHVGERLAVFVDNRLVVSPMIARSVDEGGLALDVGLSRDLATRILRGYAARDDEAEPQ